MSLLKFPAVEHGEIGSKPSIGAAWARRIAAHISLTVVLPLLPVMPISGNTNLLRQCAASLPNASRVSSAITEQGAGASPVCESAKLRSTSAATAPPAATAARKSWPSKRSPRRQQTIGRA